MRGRVLKKYWYTCLLSLIFLLGILLRLKGFAANPSFWHDECALAWNVKFKHYSDFFGTLRFLQVVPPFFMIVSKTATKFLGFSEIVLRLIPLIAGCLSIFAFYFLADKALKVKSSVFWAVFFFAINLELINYSYEFKNYSSDVLFAIICMLFFINLDIKKLNIVKSFIYGILLSVIPWFSFVAVFFMGGGFLNLFLKKEKPDLLKKIILILPLVISGLIYLKIYLINNYTGNAMTHNWQDYFITLNPKAFLSLWAENIKYLFAPIHYVLFSLILFVWGLVIYLKEKTPFSKVALLSFAVFIFASFLHIYPFASRLILFLIPLFLLFMIKPLDLASYDKKIKLFLILFLIGFTLCPQIVQVHKFIQAKAISKGEDPRGMMKFILSKAKKDDVIFVNRASDTEFAYYSSFYDIKNSIIESKLENVTSEEYLKKLNELKKGYYWFYLPFDYPEQQVVPVIEYWAKTNRMLYYQRENKCVLMYLQVI